MGNEAISLIAGEHTTNRYTYEKIETTHDLAAMVQHITTTCVEQVALVAITLYFDVEDQTTANCLPYTDAYASMDAMNGVHTLLNSLRTLVRKTDIVFLHHNRLYFLLLGANVQGGQIVQSRLWDALLWRIHNTSEGEVMRPQYVTIGHSAYPSPSTSISTFITDAHEVKQDTTILSERTPRKSGTRLTRNALPNETEEEFPALARKLGVPYLSLLPRKPLQRVQQLVNPKLAQELHCYPVGRERNILTVAMLNPQDTTALERLQQETGLLIFPVLTHPQELQTALEQLV
jgi:hypothetical protein